MKNVYLAGGCFWCIASVYYSKSGIIDVISGYSGGDTDSPTYEDVKKQKTNHRETIKIIYDESKISYKEILDVYYDNVNPFDAGGQFIDRGRSYTLAIYYQDEKEKEYVTKYIEEKQKNAVDKICISVEKFKTFYDAEEYHQHYSEKNKEAFEEELVVSGRKTRT